MSQYAQAIVFDAPQQLSVQTLEVKAFEANDIEVDVTFSGISTGTERLLLDGSMPPFPGLGYPLVPGYETVGIVSKVGESATLQLGDHVFVPGSYTFQGVRNIFGGAGSRLVVAHDRAVKVQASLGPQAVLLALAATCYHAIALGGEKQPMVLPDLIVGHGVMGRLLARITLAAAANSSTVSPRVRRAISNPPIWAGVASPSNRAVKASSASARVRGRSQARPMRGLSVSLMPPPWSCCGSESFATTGGHVRMQCFRGETAHLRWAWSYGAGP